jgi:hypothetical protein
MESNVKESSFFWLLFTIVLMIGIWYLLSSALNIAEISTNWPKYRCSPTVMPFASLYGYDTAQNFNYCLKGIFEGQLGGVTGPFATILTTMTKSLMTFLQNINSMRVMISTLVGGITKTIQEFADRFKLLFSQIRFTFLKLQILMRRLFGSFHSVIYMGLSAVQVGQNFSQTFIFKFLDTFCFAPETIILLRNNIQIPIQNVVLGDTLVNGSKVISVYKFLADGQSMVNLNGIIVSTNHFVQKGGRYIESVDHPDAQVIESWNGGILRPLICLDTDTHTIPIGRHVFSDWDETTYVDSQYMIMNDKNINGKNNTSPEKYNWKFQPALSPFTEIMYKNGERNLCSKVQLGDELSTGRVVGIGKRLVNEYCELPSFLIVTPSTLYWNGSIWVRAGCISDLRILDEPTIFYTFVVLGSATIELSTGEFVRDMCEIHSPDSSETLVRKHFAKE